MEFLMYIWWVIKLSTFALITSLICLATFAVYYYIFGLIIKIIWGIKDFIKEKKKGEQLIKALLKTKAVAKGRPRFSKWGTYTPKKTADYEKYIKEEFIKQCKKEINADFVGAIAIKVTFCIAPPKSISNKKKNELIGKPHLKRPDTDNLLKAILDSLNEVAWKDDSQIFFISALKQYAEEDLIEIEIEYMK